MSKNYSEKDTREKIIENRDTAISRLATYLTKTTDSDIAKVDKISYWLKDYVAYMEMEDSYDYSKLKKYKRGEIIKANLGFNIGSEQGGLHYCVVLNNFDNINSKTLTVIPLISHHPSRKLSPGKILIGIEIHQALSSKYEGLINTLQEQFTLLNDEMAKKPPSELTTDENDEISHRILQSLQTLNFTQRVKDELDKMKMGSVAVVSQITTISKLKIFDPKTTHDILHGIKLSEETLDLIDNKLSEMYIKQVHKKPINEKKRA